ncbi:MAG: plasmid mobilization relaxosome protein MobC [Dysosmobacter sp.]
MRTRPRCIGLWLNDAERERLMRQCAATGLNANAHIRKLIAGEPAPRPPDAYAALLRELSAIGNNINQLAHRANARGGATRAEIHAASELVQQA